MLSAFVQFMSILSAIDEMICRNKRSASSARLGKTAKKSFPQTSGFLSLPDDKKSPPKGGPIMRHSTIKEEAMMLLFIKHNMSQQ